MGGVSEHEGGLGVDAGGTLYGEYHFANRVLPLESVRWALSRKFVDIRSNLWTNLHCINVNTSD